MLSPDAPAEAERNRLLRRADWRFLLPGREPRRSICFAQGPLAAAVAAISEQMADGGRAALTPAATYDLAVVANPDRAALHQAWQALRPGGVCYAEWTRPLPGGAAAIGRRLAAAGYVAPACYWPLRHPDRAPAAVWLPLFAPAALRYYQAARSLELSAERRTLHRAAYRGKWWLWRLAQNAGLALPICAIAHKPPSAEPPSNRCGLDSLHDEWQALGLGQPPQRLTRLLLTSGLHTINRAVTLIFADDERTPRLVTKMARVPESIPSLAHEAEVLRAVHAAGQISARSAPQTLFLHAAGQAPVLGQSVIRGVPVWLALRRDNYAHLAAQATAWQVQLARSRSATQRAAPHADWRERLVTPHLAWFAECYAGIAGEQQLQQAERLLHLLGNLPSVCEHRDFAPGNVLLNGDELAVIDWECAELNGLPALDLVYFLTYLTLAVEGVDVHGDIDMSRVRAVYRAAFDPATPNGQVVDACLRQYCAAVGVDPVMLRPLRVLTWLMQAHLRRHAAAAVAVTPAQSWRRSLFVQLWQEELAHADGASV